MAVGGSRSFLSLAGLTPQDLGVLVDRAAQVADDPLAVPQSCAGAVVGMLFEQTSTRTRTAFGVAALRLGAKVLDFGPESLQLRTGETMEDTGRVLGLMLDGLVMRTPRSITELTRMVDAGGPDLINAMAREEHPTQAVCDLATLKRHFGTLDGVSMLYVGEGNNTASALALALARTPRARLCLCVPPGFGLEQAFLDGVADTCATTGAQVVQTTSLDDLPDEVHAVYTTRWQTTGTTKPVEDWRETFRPYRVDRDFLARWRDPVFLHDLPAHRGEEVSAELLDAPEALVWRQAEMKLFGAIAVVEACWGDR